MRGQWTRVIAFLSLMAALSASAFCRQDGTPTAAQRAAALDGEYKAAWEAKDWNRAIDAAKQMVNLSGSAENLRLLASAQLNAGNKEDTLATFDRALAQGQSEKPADEQGLKTWKEEMAKIYLGKGNALLKLHRSSEAVEAYNRSAEFAADPGLAYFNICATLYNSGEVAETAVACRRSVAADPQRANGWFILGSVLFVDAKADQSGKFVISPETRHALEKYLELAPDGPHAADAKQMLDMSAK